MRRFWGGRGGAGGEHSKKPKKGVSSTRLNNLFFGQRGGHHHHHHSDDLYEEINIPTGLRYTRKTPSFTYPNDLCSSARCTYRRPSSIPPISEIFGSDSHHRRHLHASSITQNFLNSSCENGNGRNCEGRSNTEISALSRALESHMADSDRNPPSPPLSISTVYQTKHVPSPIAANSDPPGSPLELPSSASSLLSKEVEKFMQQRPLPPIPCHPFFAPPLPVKQRSLPRSVADNKKVVVERKKSGGSKSGTAAISGTSEITTESISAAAVATPPPCSPTATVISITRKTTAARTTTHEPRILTTEILEYVGENIDQCGVFRNTYNRSEYPLPNSENAKLVIVDLRCDRPFFEEVLVAAFHLKDLLSEIERDGVVFLGYIRSTDFFNQAKVFILENSGCLYLYRDRAFFKVANSLGELAKHGLLDVVVYTTACALSDSDVSTLLHDEGIRKAVKNWVFMCDQKMITAAACGETGTTGPESRDTGCRSRGSNLCYRRRHKAGNRDETRTSSNLRVLNEAEYKARFLYGPLVSQSNTKDMRSVTPMYLTGFISYVLKDLKRRAQSERAWNETQNVGKAAEEMYEKVREYLLTEIRKSLPELKLDMLKRQLDSLTGECRCDYRTSTPYQHLRHVLSTLAYVVYWTCYSNGGSCMSYAVYLSVRSLIALERLVFAEITWSRLKTTKKTGRGERLSKHTKYVSSKMPPSYDPPVPEPCRTSSIKNKKLQKTAPCHFNVSTAMATLELTDDENKASQGNNDEAYYEDIEKYVCVLNDSYEI
ncbi:protein EE13 [Proboscivirus elephantidbeta5]|uniref:Protein EE13 n=1 Tax=Elephant endotheliotropic herpesvirus 5 TaxID=768738 RepID=A0A075CYL0_9BETA|nr:protein EE13 [Elephant endotheliotropic herpesvirus 5]AHC02787.1 protein EE13 [Elephant endotheliotropic herpesvirus 5]